MTIDFRKMVPEDAPVLAEILNEIIRIGGTTAYQTFKEPGYFDRFQESDNPREFLHVALVDGHVQGFQFISPLAPPETHIGSIATFAKVGGTQKGIGSALFSETRRASIAAGYTEILAVIRADNSGGLAYYGKMGFQDHGIERGVPLTDGTPVDRVHKRLVL